MGTSPSDEGEGVARAFRALASAKRLAMLPHLARPRYAEEVASAVGLGRPATQEHLDVLVDAGLARRQLGRRASGPVTEYVLVPQRLFLVGDDVLRLARLRSVDDGPLARTERVPAEGSAPNAIAGPALVLVHGLEVGRVFPLSPGSGPWSIGRDSDRVVSLDYDPFVSNRHAEVFTRAGSFRIVDTFSTNGTFLNWERLARGADAPLAPGDVVGVGRSLFVFRA